MFKISEKFPGDKKTACKLGLSDRKNRYWAENIRYANDNELKELSNLVLFKRPFHIEKD